MTTFNIRLLEDRARDVDPDLRYMALEDFQKNLNNPKIQVRHVSSFVPILFTLLSDNATEVQNQAVRSFAPLVRHVEDDEVVLVIDQLFDEMLKSSNTSKFTTSVPTLALRSIFNNSHSGFGKMLSRKIVDLLLPRVFADSNVTIDKIEILIDLIKNLSTSLQAAELSAMIESLISIAYGQSGIISKRSVAAVDLALKIVEVAPSDSSFFNKVVADVQSQYYGVPSCMASKNVRFTLFQVIQFNLQLKKQRLSETSVKIIFAAVLEDLKLGELAGVVDVENLDIDVLVLDNLVREDALITLAGLVSSFHDNPDFHIDYSSSVIEILRKLIPYDPLNYPDSEDDIADHDESDIEFSDDEEENELYENTGENDGLAAKLRLQAITLLKQMILSLPIHMISFAYKECLADLLISSISDRSDMVSNEALSTTITLVNSTYKHWEEIKHPFDGKMVTDSDALQSLYSQLFSKYAPLLENQVFDFLLTAKNISRFHMGNAFIECLISALSGELSSGFLSKLLEKLAEFNLTIKTNPDIVRLYKVVLSSYDVHSIPVSLVEYIFADLAESLNDSGTYHSFISDILQTCNILFQKVSGNAHFELLSNNSLFHSIANKINARQYSSDVRQNLLSSLTEFIVNVNVTPDNLEKAIRIFQGSLDYEVTVKFTIENLITVCNRKPDLFASQELCDLIVEKLNSYLVSSDSRLYINSLVLLDVIFENTLYRGRKEDLENLSINIFELLQESNDLNLIKRAFRVLGHSLDYLTADAVYFEKLITHVINVKLLDVDDNLKSLEYLVRQITKSSAISGAQLYDLGLNHLVLKNFISAKILATISLDCQLLDKIEAIENELASFSQLKDTLILVDKAIFDIHFLGCVASGSDLSTISFDDLLAIVNTSPNDLLCLAASRAMGMSITRDLNKYLPVLLKCYETSSHESDEKKGYLMLVAIKQVLNATENKELFFGKIWSFVLEVIVFKRGTLCHKHVSELKLAGDILSQILLEDLSGYYQGELLLSLVRWDNPLFIYTACVIIKQLLTNTKVEFDIQLIKEVLRYLPEPNLELKQAIVSTLLTGVHNKSLSFAEILNDLILPSIYEELTAKEEFRKVIPMGPYKYVVDEGLEVRKLSYELLNAIINLDTKFEVDLVKMFETLLTKGLSDSENDIINLTVLNLLQLIQNDENILTKIGNQQELIASLAKIINKKLRAKASTQESESHEDTLRTIIKLSKVINNNLVHNNTLSSEWSAYYHEVKNKHHLLFSAVEV